MKGEWYCKCPGRRQSPIPLTPWHTITKHFSSLHLDPDYYQELKASITNTGNTVEVQVTDRTASLSIYDGGLKGQYVFVSFQLHWSSEHTINGYRYPLEGHFIHYAKKYKTFKRALRHEDGIAVLAVFYDITPLHTPVFDTIISGIPEIAHKTKKSVRLQSPIVLNQFLPQDKRNFYRYKGSLTLPPYNEPVTWTIFLTPCYIITNSQLKQLTKIWNEKKEPLTSNSRRFQDEWPCTCTEGRMQSPIALSEYEATEVDLPDLKFDSNYHKEKNAEVVNNGHTVELEVINPPPPTIEGAGLDGDYVLASWHFHWAAEHTIDETRYPLEAHFVHFAGKYKTFENARNFPDGLVVLGVLYKVTLKRNPVFDYLSLTVPFIAHNTDQTVPLVDPVVLIDFFPSNVNEFFIYNGSLTTPDCSEIVTWIVFAEPSYISRAQLKLLTSIYDEDDQYLAHNYRELQERNGRPIYYNSG